ncbi:MAG: type IV secretory system conjugative DNA transfer family protein [Bacteroidia bacterium]
MNDKKNVVSMLLIMTVILFALLTVDWFYFHKFILQAENDIHSSLLNIALKLRKMSLLLRISFVAVLIASGYILPSIKFSKNIKNEDKIKWRISAVILNALIIIGYFNEISFYSFIVFPMLFLSNLYVTAKAMATIKTQLKSDEIFNTVSNKEENEFSFSFLTSKGLLTIHNPFQGIWIEGGAGSGKSASLIEPIILQAAEKGYSGIIYDYKGNPPTLGKTAYNALIHANKKGLSKVKFAMINFSNLTLSVRCNPLSPKLLDNKLFAMEVSDIIMKNLNRSWIEKTDFWGESAIAYLQSVIWMLRKHTPEFCTLPHAIAMCLSDYNHVLNYMSTDEEVKTMMRPIAVAHERKAESQLAGVVASVQQPLTKLFNKELFWVLSEDEFDLDVSKKENPVLLTICNDPRLQESLSPAISLIISVIMQNINQQGKNKSLFCIDELPTIYIKKLDNLPATARSNKVATVLAVQDYSQLERDYGKQQAFTIISNLGNQFTGMTNNKDTGKRISEQIGKIHKRKVSYSTSAESISESENLQLEDALQIKDVMGQNIGHFTGKIAGGNPPFFSTQLPEFKLDKIVGTIDNIPEFASFGVSKTAFNDLVDKNFDRIINDVKGILEPYTD